MRIIATIAAAAAVAGTAITGTAFAHHGWDAYDTAKQQKVTGTIAELKWEQPHAILFVTVGGKKQEVWLSPLQRMVDRGLQKEALKVGKTVTVDAQPHSQRANAPTRQRMESPRHHCGRQGLQPDAVVERQVTLDRRPLPGSSHSRSQRQAALTPKRAGQAPGVPR